MFLLLLHIDFNATQFVRCVTMDASCNLTHSLIQPVHGNQGSARGLEAADSSTVSVTVIPLLSPSIASQRVAQFTNAVDSLITSLFEFYARIESVEGVLSAIGISFRPFPDLSLPSLSLPSLSLDWSLPRSFVLSFPQRAGSHRTSLGDACFASAISPQRYHANASYLHTNSTTTHRNDDREHSRTL